MSRYQFIEAEKVEHSVQVLCRVLKVSRAAYYKWRSGVPRRRDASDLELVQAIEQRRKGFAQAYGSVRIHRRLRADDIHASLRRVSRLMWAKGWTGKRSRSHKRNRVVANDIPDLVQRDFAAQRPHEKYVGDITQFRVGPIWLYLAVAIDCFSRRVVGWSMSTRATTDLTVRALSMARNRYPSELPTIFHSDRGSQYTALAFQEAVTGLGMRQSLGSPGLCWDNALAESFFGVLKREIHHRGPWRSFADLKSVVFEYLECFYNSERLHSGLGYLSPADFEQRFYAQEAIA